MLAPPKGIRSYPLRNDIFLTAKAAKKVVVSGSLTVKLGILKADKHNDNKPLLWRLEILRASRLASADRLKLSAAYCEILWRGPAFKEGLEMEYARWIIVGETKEKVKNLEPVFERSDGTIFELPPHWTDLDIPDRGPNGAPKTGGGWCAQNLLPVPPPKKEAQSETKIGKFGKIIRVFNARRTFRRAAFAVIASNKIIQASIEAKNVEVKKRLEMTREFWLAEERERKCMSREERINRKYNLEAEQFRAKPLVELQIDYEREYSRMLLYIQAPPKVLGRLRFMMGYQGDGGGLVTMCEDPATHKLLNVVSVPILYPEDEVSLCDQMTSLIGKQNANLVRIIDFSVHQVRAYTHTGFASIDERVAIAVLERYEGETMLDYLQKEWIVITNDQFRLLLAQIITGLVGLHEENIVHRNISPKSVIVRRPSHIMADEALMHTGKSKLPSQPNLRLGEYWFLQNPRKAGCQYSEGRADWGSRDTAPPESMAAQSKLITDKSDIYAFGVCVYYWATGGRTLPAAYTMDTLATALPLKWGVWVHSLLRMCLQQNPKTRGTAKDILVFLSSRYGKK